MPSFESELGSLARDRQSGSRIITQGVARLLIDAPLPSPLSRRSFTDIARQILAAMPAFALLFDLLHTLGTTLFSAPDLPAVERDRFRAAVEVWLKDWSAAQEAVTRHGLTRLRDGLTVATISNSKAVRELLLAAGMQGMRHRVMVSESQPGGEGIVFAQSLRDSPHQVVIQRDETLLSRIAEAHHVILGADAVFGAAVVNKVGSSALAQAARRAQGQVWVLAETEKWAPAAWRVGFGGGSASPRPPTGGGAVAFQDSALFEPVAGQYVDLIISERGGESVASVAGQVDRKPVFQAL